jgi:two-component system response regulator VicR
MTEHATAGQPEPGDRQALSVGNLTLHLDSFRVTVEGRPVDLTYHEFELLHMLCLQPDRIIPYETLAQDLWGPTPRARVRHLNVLVHRIRSKLVGLHPFLIETVRGRGYGLLHAITSGKERPHDPRAGPGKRGAT